MTDFRELDGIDIALAQLHVAVLIITNPQKTSSNSETKNSTILSTEKNAELYASFATLLTTKNKLHRVGEIPFDSIDFFNTNPNEFITAIQTFKDTYQRLKPPYSNDSWKKLRTSMDMLLTVVGYTAAGAVIGGVIASTVILATGGAPILCIPLCKIGALIGAIIGLTEAEKMSLSFFPTKKDAPFYQLDAAIANVSNKVKKSLLSH